MSKVFGQALLDDIVTTQSLPTPLVKQAAREILAVIREGLIQEGVVKVSHFGTFRLKPVAARQGINPRTGKRITIPAQQRVIFTPCKALRELIQPVHRAPVPLEPERSPTDSNPSTTAAAAFVPRYTTRKNTVESIPIASEQAIEAEASTLPAAHIDSQSRALPVEEKTQKQTNTPDPAIPLDTVPLTETEHEVTQQSLPKPALNKKDEATELAVAPIKSQQHEQEQVHEAQGEPVIAQPGKKSVTEIPRQPENSAHTESKTLPQKEISPSAENVAPRANRHYLLGAAAILLITLMGIGLLSESGTDNNSSPTTVATAPVKEPLVTTNPTSEPATLAENRVAAPESMAEVINEESDSSGYNTETDGVAPSETTVALDAIAENSVAERPVKETTHVVESGAPAVTQEHFFNEQTHEVNHGESLWRLARHHYQDPLLWPHIYQANTATIANPDHLLVGSMIAIPGLQGSPDQLTKADRRHIAEGYYLAYQYYKKIGRADALFALLEAKRYDSTVVEEHRSLMQLSKLEELQLAQQQMMPFNSMAYQPPTKRID